MDKALALLADYSRTASLIHADCRKVGSKTRCTSCQLRIGGLRALAEQIQVALTEGAES